AALDERRNVVLERRLGRRLRGRLLAGHLLRRRLRGRLLTGHLLRRPLRGRRGGERPQPRAVDAAQRLQLRGLVREARLVEAHARPVSLALLLQALALKLRVRAHGRDTARLPHELAARALVLQALALVRVVDVACALARGDARLV